MICLETGETFSTTPWIVADADSGLLFTSGTVTSTSALGRLVNGDNCALWVAAQRSTSPASLQIRFTDAPDCGYGGACGLLIDVPSTLPADPQGGVFAAILLSVGPSISACSSEFGCLANPAYQAETQFAIRVLR